MKKVVSPSQVAHLWANQVQPEAKNSGRTLYFNNDTIYSYGSHFPIAKHITNKQGNKAVLFTERSYSNTTAKHINHVRSACNHLNIIYCYSPEFSPAENFEVWLKDSEQILTKLAKAKKPELYLTELNQLNDKVQKYATFLGEKIPKDLSKVLNVSKMAENIKLIEDRAESVKIEGEKRKQVELLKFNENLTKWYNGELYRLNSNPSDYDYLRYNEGKKRIETSQAVEIPEKIAKNFYHSLIVTLKAGGCFECTNLNVLDYEAKEVNENWIKIGCHTIQWSEINKIAILLTWNVSK